MGLGWGATVICVARRKASTWQGLIQAARTSAGTLVFPVKPELDGNASDEQMASAGGADLMVDTPEIAAWLKEAAGFAKSVTVGVYTYLDGDAHVKVSLACDAIIQELLSQPGVGERLSLAYIQTPSLTYTISPEAHSASVAHYRSSFLGKIGLQANARRACVTDRATEPELRYVH